MSRGAATAAAIVTATIAVVAGLGAGGCGQGARAAALVEVKREELVLAVEVSGGLEAVDSTGITPPAIADVWNFKIASLAPEGAEVVAGAPVISFDPSEQTRTLETMVNEADAVQKKLDKKRDDAALMRRDDRLPDQRSR
jgi:multidrug efflux pump subunit AcrA (membrane-fusion protein)